MPTADLWRLEMAQVRTSGPYIWVTWLTKLLVGENSCEWAAWFRAQHEGWSWSKIPGTFDQAAWQLAHTAKLTESRLQWEEQGFTVFTEGQNHFTLRGASAALGGRPDLIAWKDGAGTIIDVKTGQPRPSHSVQVMLYMYAIPRAWASSEASISTANWSTQTMRSIFPASAVDDNFVGNMSQLIRRIASETPARRVPSRMECGFCDITSADCHERAADDSLDEGATEDF